MGGKSSKVVDFRDYENTGYWRGPYGILVPNFIAAVMCEDQTNYVMRPGDIRTNAHSVKKPLTKQEFMTKYGTKYFAENFFQSSPEIEKELTDHRVYTRDKRGKEKVYKRMNSGELFKETKRGVKTIQPVPYKK